MTEKRRPSTGEGLIVRAEPCDQCLFSKNKIVSNARRKEILAGLVRDDTHFICHKATNENRYEMCAGDFKRDPRRTTGMRIAHALDAVIFVDSDGFIKD